MENQDETPTPQTATTMGSTESLAIKLFNASEAQKRKQPKGTWGTPRKWRDLPSESVAVWIAVATAAIRHVNKQNSPLVP